MVLDTSDYKLFIHIASFVFHNYLFLFYLINLRYINTLYELIYRMIFTFIGIALIYSHWKVNLVELLWETFKMNYCNNVIYKKKYIVFFILKQNA